MSRGQARSDWGAYRRACWECEDTLDPAARLAQQARIRRAIGIRRRARRVRRGLSSRERRRVIERRRARTAERRAYRRLWMRRWRQSERAKWLCEQREEARKQARLRSGAHSEAA